MQARKVNKTVNDVRLERNAKGAELINYGNSNRVIMEWGWSEEANHARVVRIKVGKEQAIISAEEFMRFIRWA